jgi:GT2 family glycosyltransferase
MAGALVQTVIVNYNSGEWLLRAVRSALECIPGLVTVVDNASSDNSIALLNTSISDSRLNVIQNTENIGFSAANNQVLKKLDAEFVVLMNPDCELEPTVWPLISEAMLGDMKIGLAGGRILNIDGSDQKTSKRDFPTLLQALFRLVGLEKLFNSDFDRGIEPIQGEVKESTTEYVDAISGAFMIARSSAIEDVGLLDEGYFMHCEDLDWCKRFWLSGYKVAWIGAAQLVHEKGVSSRARPVRVLWYLHRGMDRFFGKFEGKKYNFLLRGLIRIGIYLLFIPRALWAIVKKVS